MGKGGLWQRRDMLAASMKTLVEVLASLFPSHAVSSSALAACAGFTPGHASGWEVRAGCSFLLQCCVCSPKEWLRNT